MTTIEAIENDCAVTIEFCNTSAKRSWYMTFTEKTPLAIFFNDIIGEVEYVGEATKEKPYQYFKRLYIEEDVVQCTDCASA